MPKMTFGDKMPKTYLEVYKPAEGTFGRIAILDMESLVGVAYHYVDGPQTKGMFECTQGACCSSGLCGQVNQSYGLPIWVYVNPPTVQNGFQGTADGVLQILKMPASLYETLLGLANAGWNLMDIDLSVIPQKSGRGTKLQLQPVQDATLLPADYRRQLASEIPDLVGQVERSIARSLSDADWMKVIAELAAAQVALGPQNRPQVGVANPKALFAPPAQQQLPAGQSAAQVQQAVPGARPQPVFAGQQAPAQQARPGMPQQARPGAPAQAAVPGVRPGMPAAGNPAQRVAPRPAVAPVAAQPNPLTQGFNQGQGEYVEADGEPVGEETISPDEASSLLG